MRLAALPPGQTLPELCQLKLLCRDGCSRPGLVDCAAIVLQGRLLLLLDQLLCFRDLLVLLLLLLLCGLQQRQHLLLQLLGGRHLLLLNLGDLGESLLSLLQRLKHSLSVGHAVCGHGSSSWWLMTGKGPGCGECQCRDWHAWGGWLVCVLGGRGAAVPG